MNLENLLDRRFCRWSWSSTC